VSDADRNEIEAAIPHRDPFLFVDRIIARSEDALDCAWRVPPDAAWFEGHYPGAPVTPGVILSEHVFQCAAILASERSQGFGNGGGVPVLTTIERARFKRMVAPGEALETRVELTEQLGPAWYMKGTVRTAGDERATVLSIRFVLSVAPSQAGAERDSRDTEEVRP
jgi:3-hydroxyacyl-[acyl-carrier-protein] dehydratase